MGPRRVPPIALASTRTIAAAVLSEHLPFANALRTKAPTSARNLRPIHPEVGSCRGFLEVATASQTNRALKPDVFFGDRRGAEGGGVQRIVG